MRAAVDAAVPRPMLVVPRPGAERHGHGHLARGPILRAVARRTFPRMLEASIVPALLLYLIVLLFTFELATLAIVAWTFGAVARRRYHQQPVPGLLVLAAVGVTVRTALALWSGSTVVYFLQPIGATTAVALLFLASVAFGRPLVGRLAADFFPFAPEIADLPAVVRLFRGLTVLWSVVQLVKAAATLAMLGTMPVTTYIACRTIATLALTAIGIYLTITWSLRTARREGLTFAMA
jgi:hypothetical protein